MPQFTALVVTRHVSGSPATYTLTHEIENRRAMFDYILNRYSTDVAVIESITILEEEK